MTRGLNIALATSIQMKSRHPSGKNTSLLFIHGTAVYARFYAEFLYQMNLEGYRIVAPDLPGHGLSDGKRGHFGMEELTDTIYDVTSHVIEKHGENVVVMGSSLGGITALYSVANDERIKAGICHNAAIFNEGAHKKIIKLKGFYKVLRHFVRPLSKIMPTLSFSVWIYLDPTQLFRDPSFLDERLDVLLNDPLASDRYTLKALATQMKAPLARPIEEIETPILLINPDGDVLFSVEYMTEIFNRLEKSKYKRLEIIKDASHMILHERRNECVQKITAWLKNVPLNDS